MDSSTISPQAAGQRQFVAIVLLTGMGRTFTYIENVYGKDAEKLRKKMLIIKHILLFGIFGTGTYWQYTMVFN